MVLAMSGRISERRIAADRLIDHVTNYMVAAASVAGKTKPLFSVDGGTTGPYTRNPQTWLPGVDWSCVPVKVDYGAGNVSSLYRGCLVTPIHLLSVNHGGYVQGNTVYFLGTDNTVYSRTIALQNFSLSANDMRVSILSSALPSAVVPAELIPANIGTWIDTVDHDDLASPGFPIVTLDGELKITTHRWTGYQNGFDYFATMPAETVSPMSAYAESFVAGDSASPCFAIISGKAVLVALAATDQNTGPSVNKLRVGLDAAIAALGGGYSLQSVDLMGFST